MFFQKWIWSRFEWSRFHHVFIFTKCKRWVDRWRKLIIFVPVTISAHSVHTCDWRGRLRSCGLPLRPHPLLLPLLSRTRIHVHTYMDVHICRHVRHMRMRVHTPCNTTCMHAHQHTHTRTYMCIYIYIYVCVCIYIYIHFSSMGTNQWRSFIKYAHACEHTTYRSIDQIHTARIDPEHICV